MPRAGVTLPSLKRSGISGIKEMRDTIGHIIDKTGAEALKDVFYEAGMVLYNDVASILDAIPLWKGNKKFPPGTLRKGLFITRGKGGKESKANVLVGISGHPGAHSGANYLAIWREHGTSKQTAKPFWRPAVLKNRPAMAQIIAQGIKDAIDKAATE